MRRVAIPAPSAHSRRHPDDPQTPAMIRLFLRLLINVAAFWVAAQLVKDIQIRGGYGSWLLLVVFGLVNTFVRPFFRLLTFPINLLTLGLLTLVINALMLLITGRLASGILTVGGFVPALLGGIVISIVSTVLSWLLPDPEKES